MKNMSRENIHSKIDELLGSISINNNRLSLHEERLSQLDIDVLRKNCIELYEHINLLALEKKQLVKKKEKKIKIKKAAAPPKKAKVKKVEVIEPVVEEVKIEQAKEPAASKKKPVVDEEKSYLFQKFSSKPIKSIAKAISLVKKFEYQKSFFDGDGNAYKTFISALDNAVDREEAFMIYHDTKKKYTWENEELRDELKALMYRKFA